MQPITLEYTADILAGIAVTAMPSLFAQGDKLAHTLRIQVKADGQAVALAGWAVTANMIRQDQTTVTITGKVVGNAAEVTLEAACYGQSGGFTLSVSLSKDGQLITIFCGRGDVTRTRTDSLVDPGHVIPSIDEIIAQYGLMKTAVQNADEATKRANTAADSADKVAKTVQKKLDNGDFIGPQGETGATGRPRPAGRDRAKPGQPGRKGHRVRRAKPGQQAPKAHRARRAKPGQPGRKGHRVRRAKPERQARRGHRAKRRTSAKTATGLSANWIRAYRHRECKGRRVSRGHRAIRAQPGQRATRARAYTTCWTTAISSTRLRRRA